MKPPKSILLNVNQQDVRRLCANALSYIVNRQIQGLEKITANLKLSIAKGTKEEILSELELLLKLYKQTIIEVRNISPLVAEIEELIPPADTKVVEDLPDLLKDSSGVD